MGAGISPKKKHQQKYRRLNTVERDLLAAGISCSYKNLEVKGEHFVTYFSGIGPASNGESMSWLVLRFNPDNQPSSEWKKQGDIDYTDFHARDIPEHEKGGWEAGVQRLINLYIKS